MPVYKKVFFFLLFTITLLAIWLYRPLGLYFLNDDFIHIPLSARGDILQRNSFRPICDLSVMLDFLLWKEDAFGYHLTNLILHLLNSLLLFFLSKKTLKRYFIIAEAVEAGIVVSVLFFIYSMHSEAVFWILGRSAMLGCLFFIPAILFYYGRDNIYYLLLSLLLMFLSWLSYESTWVLPVIVMGVSIIDLLLRKTSLRSELIKLSLVFVWFTFYLVIRYNFIHELFSEYSSGSLRHLDLVELAIRYMKMAVRSFMPPLVNPVESIVLFFAFGLCVGTIVYITKSGRRNNNALAVLLSMWLVSLFPVFSLGIDTRGTESERYLYLPALFTSFFLTVLLYRIRFQSFRLVMVILLLNFHLVFLYSSMKGYRFASSITKATIDEVKSITKSGTLYVENLPGEYHGALIFRDGFKEAVNWMKENGALDSIIIISKQNANQHYALKYSINLYDSLIKPPGNYLFYRGKDVYFKFEDSGMSVLK